MTSNKSMGVHHYKIILTRKDLRTKTKLNNLDGAEIHGVLDDLMVVMEAESFCINRLVKRPGVRCVFLGQHLFDEACTGTQLLLAFRRRCPPRLQTTSQVVLRVRLRCVSFGLL